MKLKLVILYFVVVLGFVCVQSERSDHRCGKSFGNPPCGYERCCSRSGWCGDSASYCQGGNCAYQCWTVAIQNNDTKLRNDNKNNDISKIISKPLFDEMFKHRNDCPSQGFYTYEAFVDAASSFPGFASTGDIVVRKRELAAFLGQISSATAEWSRHSLGVNGYSKDAHSWGLCHINTTNIESENDFCTSPEWPCSSGKKYNSRGPIQLTFNSNYGLAGEALGLDLVNDPDLVATDSVVSFKTAIWFWMTPQAQDKLSCHDIVIKANSQESIGQIPSYGVISDIIRSYLATAGSYIPNCTEYYKRYCDMLQVSYGPNLKYWYGDMPNDKVSFIKMPVI